MQNENCKNNRVKQVTKLHAFGNYWDKTHQINGI